MMELLSPAGSREAVAAAVQNGADAVYLGGSLFNARRSAANFDEAAMTEVIDYCHIRGVKVYVTLNTLILGREMAEAVKYAAFLYRTGADAVIVQDVGAASLLRQELPGLPLHASTQMGIHNASGAQTAQRLGMQRAVLSRETPLSAIQAIHNSCDIALEAFAHGALCMSFSGACLLSSMAGERSGNRGTCAQPCRKRMSVMGMPGQSDYALSLGDLCMIEHLADMEKAGISCIKLEGRMKRAEYVAVVTQAYRAALDGAYGAQMQRLKNRMLDMFDRGGGCSGYFYGNDTHTGCVAQSDKSKALIAEAAASYQKDTRKRPVEMALYMRTGERARLTMASGEASASFTGDTVEIANKPQSRERYIEQVKKLGETPFAASNCSADIDENAFLPMSAVNTLRRGAAKSLEEALSVKREVAEPVIPAAAIIKAQKTVVTAIASTAAQAAAAFDAGADEVALEPCEYTKTAFECLQKYRNGAKLLISLPVVIISEAEAEKIRGIAASGLVDGGIAANIGGLPLIERLPLKIAGTQMNVMNEHALEAYKNLGFDRVTLSLELTKPQLRDMCGADTAVSVYGRAQLMQLRHCPKKEYEGCKNCRGMAGSLTDEAGRVFPLCNISQEGGCLVRLLNCLPTDIIDLYGELPPSAAMQLAFYDETPAAVRERVSAAVSARSGIGVEPPANATRGHWARAVK